MTDVDSWLAVTRDGGLLPERHLRKACLQLEAILVEESTVHQVSAPVTIVGHVGGQFDDLLKVIGISGDPSETSYVFLGGY